MVDRLANERSIEMATPIGGAPRFRVTTVPPNRGGGQRTIRLILLRLRFAPLLIPMYSRRDARLERLDPTLTLSK